MNDSSSEGPNSRRSFVTGAAALVSAGTLSACAQAGNQSTAGGPRPFSFAVIGDMPYNRGQEAEYARVMDELNARELAFVAHIGDFQFDPRPYMRAPASARPPGDDATYDYVLGTFAASRNPLVVALGDNDWADLVELSPQKHDPLERLAHVRSRFYPAGQSLGQRKLAVSSQAQVDTAHAEYLENLIWSSGGVTFATLHIVGSNDNVGRTPAMDDEQKRRQAANLAWLRRAFAQAKSQGSAGLVLITHANMGLENHWPPSYYGRYFRPLTGFKAPAKAEPTAYDEYIKTLAAEMESYSRPTLFVHGDTHLFRIDKPLFSSKTRRPFVNFTRVETFGWPDTHWVQVTVDPADPQLFTIRPQVVAGNNANPVAR